MRNKKIGRRGLNPIFLFFFCQYTVQMIDGGGEVVTPSEHLNCGIFMKY